MQRPRTVPAEPSEIAAFIATEQIRAQASRARSADLQLNQPAPPPALELFSPPPSLFLRGSSDQQIIPLEKYSLKEGEQGLL